jgi:hypothetical protein
LRLFQAKLIDEFLEDPNGAGAFAISSTSWACLLPRAEALKFTCVVDTVTGSPTLILNLLGSNSDWNYLELTKPLFAASVSGVTTITPFYSPADATYPPPRHLFLEAVVTGSGTKAHVKLWVCGRGPQLLEPTPPAPPTFAAQYDAARFIADEDRLPGKKRALKQGASLFYPPGLFLPSLKWDR